MTGMQEIITWITDTTQLPDDEITVMINIQGHDEPVWMGYHEDYCWYLVDGTPLAENSVIAWADLPYGLGEQNLTGVNAGLNALVGLTFKRGSEDDDV